MKTKVLEEIKNLLFISKEDNTIEHVDCGYEQFIELIEKSLTEYAKQIQSKHTGCDKCFDKGYRTELKGRRDLGKLQRGDTYHDFKGKQIDSFISMEYCDCNRGEDLKKHTEEVIKDLIGQPTGYLVMSGELTDEEAPAYDKCRQNFKDKAKERYNINLE